MCKIIKAILLIGLLSGCEDCSQPTKKVCVRMHTVPIVIYNAAARTPMITMQAVCDEYTVVPNECYGKEK